MKAWRSARVVEKALTARSAAPGARSVASGAPSAGAGRTTTRTEPAAGFVGVRIESICCFTDLRRRREKDEHGNRTTFLALTPRRAKPATECREELLLVSDRTSGVEHLQCERGDQQIVKPSAVDREPGVFICRCVDLQQKATTQETRLSMHEARLERLEKRGIAPPAASVRTEDLERQVEHIERLVIEKVK